jgi:hypothetical protein
VIAHSRFWHEAAVRKCPLLRRVWGPSGHRSFRGFGREFRRLLPKCYRKALRHRHCRKAAHAQLLPSFLAELREISLLPQDPDNLLFRETTWLYVHPPRTLPAGADPAHHIMPVLGSRYRRRIKSGTSSRFSTPFLSRTNGRCSFASCSRERTLE